MEQATHRTKQILADFGFDADAHFTAGDVSIIQYVAAAISQRAAVLVSVTTSVLLRRIPDEDITIAIDGSVYKCHPRMHGWLQRIIRRLVPKDKKV